MNFKNFQEFLNEHTLVESWITKPVDKQNKKFR